MKAPNWILWLGVVLIFAVQSVQAASISTRVRILESKVKKHDRQIRANTKAIAVQRNAVKKQGERIDKLEGRVGHLESFMKKRRGAVDKRYFYP
ncbi:hypothetical protein SAMN05443662_1085 [Sulfurivirga caldicuralii]|uniref:Uncharacterized protein n=1 Tax=Sulfurivirga caldicuralii TaxID=364032 RepID=A0A1N6FHX4_9GAMM|nr:hypothetical protein [Sulfurivirga caldicuralii]SIN94830.1 hypothetical protein SAMN05443662_1085 [Sulfurivirga caldicuralii]